MAERSFDHDDRIRQFTTDHLVAFAATVELPVTSFLIAPLDVEQIRRRRSSSRLSRSI